MITTHLRNLLTAVVCLFAGVSAQAQFSGSATQYPTTDYSASPISFELSAVAAALDTDAATLGAALAEYIEAETPATSLFFVQQPDGTESSDPTADANGFWMDAEGTNVGWGDYSVFYASPDVDVDANTFAFYVGQMPGVMEPEQSASATIKLKFNGKEVSFAITLNVIAKPVYDIPEPATVIEKELNVVGSAEVTVEQYPRGGYDSDVVQIEASDVVAKLGLTSGEMLADVLGDILYCTAYNNGDVEVGGGLKKDSLTNESTAGEPGFWLRPVMNEDGIMTNECCAAGWGSDDRFFAESFAYDAESGNISFKLGQYPGVCGANDTYFTNCYIIYGDKAYKLNINLKILEKEQGNALDGMTKVGEMVKEFEQAPTTAHEAIIFTVDVDAIAEALGCEVGDFSMQALDEYDDWGGTTANNGGYWLNDNGRVVAYASGAMFIEPQTRDDYSILKIGQYPNHFNVGDTWEGELYFVNGQNYYTFKAKMTIIELEIPDQDKYKIVATRNASKQVVAINDYLADQTSFVITPEEMEAIIGTATPELYCEATDADYEETGMKYVIDNYKGHHCDPRPGIWFNADGKSGGWGSSSPVGICYDLTSGEFTVYQYPGVNNVGDVFKCNLYFVNTENDDEWPMLQVKFNVQFVSEIATYNQVGQSNVTIPVTSEETDFEIPDFAAAAEALGVTVDDLLDRDTYYWHGMTSDGLYGEGQSAENGLAFGEDGGFDINGSIFFYEVHKDGDKVVATTAADAEVDDDFTADGQFCLRVGENEYVYIVRFVSEAIYTGIKNVGDNSLTTSNHIFDLSGRQVQKPVRGLYIQNGRKFVVK